MLLFDLFKTFFKIGAFTFGGGYAMIPLIEREIIENKGWIVEEELLEVISISQMTPGVIAINAATFVGKKTCGTMGGILASLAVVLPSLFTISFVVHFLSDSFNDPAAVRILTGIRAGVVAMITKSVVKLIKNSANTKFKFTIFIIALAGLIFALVSPITLIIIGALFGILFYKTMPKAAIKVMGREVV